MEYELHIGCPRYRIGDVKCGVTIVLEESTNDITPKSTIYMVTDYKLDSGDILVVNIATGVHEFIHSNVYIFVVKQTHKVGYTIEQLIPSSTDKVK